MTSIIPNDSFLPPSPQQLHPSASADAMNQTMAPTSPTDAPSGDTLMAMSDSPKFKPKLLPHSVSLQPLEVAPRSRPASATPKIKPRTPKPSTSRPASAGVDPINPLSSSVVNSAPQKPPEMNRPLDVTDALSYLDAVKVQFHDQPDVYNQFLDIMKDFKSQVIDTPGVISRVSQLFSGNPLLIQGFNTFLPVGYRIDASSDPRDNMITVTTPLGTIRQSTFAQVTMPSRELSVLPPPPTAPGMPPSSYGPGHVLTPQAGGTLSRSITPHAFQLPHQPPAYDGTYSPGFQGAAPRNAAALLGNLNSNNPVEHHTNFNHAIQYLNKIKARYADDPNTYKQFLEILKNHHKEQQHTQESQVHAQVQMLFKDAPDLLHEFKDFAPTDGGGYIPPSTGTIGIMPLPAGGSGAPGMPWALQDFSMTTDRVKKPPGPSKRKKRQAEKEDTPIPAGRSSQSRSKKPRSSHKHDASPPPFSPFQGPMAGPNAPGHGQFHTTFHQNASQHLHSSHFGHTTIQGGSSAPDELLFIDRAKRVLEPREMYEDFLRLLDTFNCDIIDSKTLIAQARVILGNGDLLTQFKDVMGWDDKQTSVEHGPPGSIRTGPPEALLAQPVTDGGGPSYRKLPDSEVRLACSGRDELCRSVLNDAWVSHPTWASEESGFVAHKKNTFEEALHKSEEERHEYHVHIEALARTIALLEPINSHIEDMSNEERASFRLKPDLGGSSKSIYHRTIKKIYGRDQGIEVISALQECPVVAVPVILARCKQKDEEWRRAQREWSRTWREVDAKNFYKSLDHQGISFKANDKKSITAKHFVGDIESVKESQVLERDKAGKNQPFLSSVGHQLEYSFEDMSVLQDCLKMVYSFLDHSQALYGAQERRSLEKFIRAFIPILFMCPPAEFNAACGPLNNMHEDEHTDMDLALDSRRSGRQSTGTPQVNNTITSGVAASDLRKKLLKTVQDKANKKDGEHSRIASRATSVTPRMGSPAPPHIPEHDVEDVWIRESSAAPAIENPGLGTLKLERRPFFANTTFYTLLRLLQLLYSRLLLCKEVGEQLIAKKHASLHPNAIAVELGLDDPNGPSAVLAQAKETLAVDGSTNLAYAYLLDAWEKVCDGELEQATFEEQMRWFFGNKAYHVFTLDKVVTALAKQVQTIISDNKCQELWSLLQSARSADTLCNRDIVRHRRLAERHVGLDDHLYRVEWLNQSKTMRIQLLDADDPSVEEHKTAIGQWREYVDTYTMRQPTEWLPRTESENASPLFLRRTIMACDAPALRSDMVIRISLGTYKIFWEAGSEDVWWRRRDSLEHEMLSERAKSRHEERLRCKWLQS